METFGDTDFNAYAKVFIFLGFSHLTEGFVHVFSWKMPALAGWLAGWFAGWLGAGYLAGWLASWLAWQRWLAGWLGCFFEVHSGQVFTCLFEGNRLGVWLAGWLAGWLALVEFCGVFVWLFHFERVFMWLSDANVWFSRAVVQGWLAGSGGVLW